MDKMQLFAAAFEAFGSAVRGVGGAFRTFAYRFRLAGAHTERERRRIIRDWHRANRRPALIHNGSKPRRRHRLGN